jgi:hypothetical protein
MRQAASAETTIIEAAQHLVDNWLRSNKRGPFGRAVHQAELSWGHSFATDLERTAFGRVANAIRVGKGHARLNPAPLLLIIRDTFRGRTSSPDA